MMIKNLDVPLDEFAIDVHGVLIEAIIEVISEFLILRFPVGGVGEVVLIEGVLEDILGLHYVNRPSSHYQLNIINYQFESIIGSYV